MGWEFILTIIIAVVTSDVSAMIISFLYEKHRAKKARLTKLHFLTGEVNRIRKIANKNSEINTVQDYLQPILQMPVTAFETAFVHGESQQSVREELLQAVADYLVLADQVNSLIESYHALISSSTGLQPQSYGLQGASRCADIARQIKEKTQQAPLLLDAIETSLLAEIKG